MLLSRLKHLKRSTRQHPPVDDDTQQRTEKLQPLACRFLQILSRNGPKHFDGICFELGGHAEPLLFSVR